MVFEGGYGKAKDNDVQFKNSNIDFTLYSYYVTEGEAYDGVTCSGDTMDVKAGRSASSGPATGFNVGLD